MINMNLQLIVISSLLTCYSCNEITLISQVLQLPIVSNLISDLLSVSDNLIPGGVPDAHRNPCQLIESRNFICDQHFITTKDEYILSIQHIINPLLATINASQHIGTVIFTHGLVGSATVWLINSDNGFADDWTGNVINADLDIEGRIAPYLLANLGYDVWMANLRGCRYSRSHAYLNPDTDNKYWQFSYQQMTTFDVPAIVDYVLMKTGQSKLTWIGHSMGTLIMFGLLSERPEYSSKIKTFIALAPVAYVGNITSPLRELAYVPELKEILTQKGGEFTLPLPLLSLIANQICVLPVLQSVCTSLLATFGVNDFEQLNFNRLSAYIEGGFCGTSFWTFIHFLYAIEKNQFAKFDFGQTVNTNVYNSVDPPPYNLSLINLENIILFNSYGDIFADPVDVMKLKSQLTVPFIEYTVPYQKFSHFDFLWAENVYSQVYGPLVSFLKKV